MATDPTAVFYHNLRVDGHIISRDFPGALDRFSTGFDRLNTADCFSIFSNKNYGFVDTEIWESSITGNGSLVYNDIDSSLLLIASDNATVVHQTRAYHNYQPGKVHECLMTGVLRTSDSAASGAIYRIGMYDSNEQKTPVSDNDRGGDGHFFEYDTTQDPPKLYVVERYSTTTSPQYQSDVKVEMASWNVDKLDGEGDSLITTTAATVATTCNIFFIRTQWLGTGSVLMGISVDGLLIPVHRFQHALTMDTTYMKRATLPLRYEVVAGTTGGAAKCRQICTLVNSLGGYNPKPRIFYVERRGVPLQSNQTEKVAMAIRLRTDRNRYTIYPHSLHMYSSTVGQAESLRYILSLDGTPSATPVWSNAGNNSAAQVWNLAGSDVAMTTAGVSVIQGYLTNQGNTVINIDTASILPITSSIAGTSRILYLSIVPQSGSNVTGCNVLVGWSESM